MTKCLFAAALFLAACHDRSRPLAPTPEQSNQLNEADEMLNDMSNNEVR